jgi:hypothetical protein
LIVSAANKSFTIRKGRDFSVSFEFLDPDDEPVDLAGSTFKAEIRRSPTSTTLVEEFDVTVVGSTVTLSMPDARTSAIAAGPKTRDAESRYVYDVKWTDSRGFAQTILEGLLLVHTGVTR